MRAAGAVRHRAEGTLASDSRRPGRGPITRLGGADTAPARLAGTRNEGTPPAHRKRLARAPQDPRATLPSFVQSAQSQEEASDGEATTVPPRQARVAATQGTLPRMGRGGADLLLVSHGGDKRLELRTKWGA